MDFTVEMERAEKVLEKSPETVIPHVANFWLLAEGPICRELP
jgi:hypothetical protein